ncbi:MAG: conserved membrane protein of unknown function [Promethearchaeota archaeon]|nr:MAG: conserved membrane protein of unknown function [Candidatus Lokiarchaeota archaeon]
MELKSKFKKLFEKVPLPYWGLISIIILAIGCIIPSIAYTGTKGESYSFLNHAISELGELGVSELAILFNICLIIGGSFAFIAFLGLAFYIDNKVALVAGIIGAVSSVGGVLVGFFPMNYLIPHYFAAMTFFFGGMLTVAIFSISIVLDKDKKIHWIFSVLGFVVVVFFALFLFYPYGESSFRGAFGTLGELFYQRPDFLLPFFFEWMTLITIMIWVGILSIVFIIQDINFS